MVMFEFDSAIRRSMASFHLLILLAVCFACTCITVQDAAALPEKTRAEDLGSIGDPDEKKEQIALEKLKHRDPLADIEGDFPSLPEKISWEIILSQKAYRVTQNLRTASDLVTAIQKGIDQLCFDTLQKTLQYRPNDRVEQCLNLQKYLAEIDPNNTALPCLDYGLDSLQCKDAYKAQEIVTSIPQNLLSKYEEISGEARGRGNTSRELDILLEAERARNIMSKINQTLSRVQTALGQKNNDPALLNQRAVLLDKYIATACGSYRIVFFPSSSREKDTDSSIAKARSTAKPAAGSIEDLLSKGPFAVTPGAGKPETIDKRFRLVHSLCVEGVNFVRNQDPRHPGIVCHYQGVTSPDCIAARKANDIGSLGSISENSNQGMERFGNW
jgi:hypothetical protein